MIDFSISDEGSLFLLTPNNPIAQEWVEDNLPSERLGFGNSVVVEPRYIQDITWGILGEGLTIKKDGKEVYIGQIDGHNELCVRRFSHQLVGV